MNRNRTENYFTSISKPRRCNVLPSCCAMFDRSCWYFTSALIEVSKVSFVGNEQQLVNQLSDAFIRAGRQGNPLWRNLV